MTFICISDRQLSTVDCKHYNEKKSANAKIDIQSRDNLSPMLMKVPTHYLWNLNIGRGNSSGVPCGRLQDGGWAFGTIGAVDCLVQHFPGLWILTAYGAHVCKLAVGVRTSRWRSFVPFIAHRPKVLKVLGRVARRVKAWRMGFHGQLTICRG